jgi:hypothetical protein
MKPRPPTIRGTPQPKLEIRVCFAAGHGWYAVIHDGFELRGQTMHFPTARAAFTNAIESLEAAA